MFASGYTPIYAAHVPPANYRTSCIGTGPFKVKEWRKGEFVDYVKNPDYFVKGRPYLDSIRYVVIENRGTRMSALQAGKVDVSFPGEMSKTIADQIKKAVPQMVVTTVGQTVSDNIIMNVKKPPFDNLKVRLAVSYAIDRRGMIQAVHQGGAVRERRCHPSHGASGASLSRASRRCRATASRPTRRPRRGRSWPSSAIRREAAQGRDRDPRHRHLHGHGLLRHQ
jgi:ABC-type transport system substrate-binding protein